jgi:eukaryotic-like serine/threonine-protein kinase
MNLTPGTLLQDGKYLINHVLADSGLGLMLKGTQVPMNQAVLLQTLQRPQQTELDWAAVKQRFIEQVRRFSACNHPGLVQIVDQFEENDIPFAVLDYTPGQTLAERVRSQGKLSPLQAIHYIQQIGSALMEIHRCGLLHRAITPEAIVHPAGSDVVVLGRMSLTHPAVLGWVEGLASPPAREYAAIEQYQAHTIPTPAIDVYSLAGTLYFLITGQAPISAPLRSQTPLPPLRQFCPDLDPRVEAAILRGLELDFKQRPQTIALWLTQFNELTPTHFQNNGSKVLASPPALPERLKTSPAPAQTNGVAPSHSMQRVDAAPALTAPSPSKAAVAVVDKPKPAAPAAFPSQKIGVPSRLFSTSLVTFGVAAGLVGLSAGLLLRLAATTSGAGSTFFHSEQTFPPIPNWPGESVPAATVPVPTAEPAATIPATESTTDRLQSPPATLVEPELTRSTASPTAKPSPIAPASEIDPLPQQPVPPTGAIANPEPAPSVAPAAPPAVIEPVAPPPSVAPVDPAPLPPSAPAPVTEGSPKS